MNAMLALVGALRDALMPFARRADDFSQGLQPLVPSSLFTSSARRADERLLARSSFFTCAILLLSVSISFAQNPAPQPTSAKPETSGPQTQQPTPAEKPEALTPSDSAQPEPKPPAPEQPAAIVIEVAGTAHWAPAKTSPLVDEGWTPIKLADRFTSGTLIRTGLRSHVNLQFGETTTVSVRGATYASVDQYYRSANMETVNIGLGYGTVRGGSSEGTFRSQVTIDSPVATLAKRGTQGWEISVEAATGRYRIALAEEGLVEAIQKAFAHGASPLAKSGKAKIGRGGEGTRGDEPAGQSGERVASRTVQPGEYATETNIRNVWIEQAVFDRNVWFYDPWAITPSDAAFAATNPRGFGPLSPGGGAELRDLTLRDDPSFFFAQSGLRPPSSPVRRPDTGPRTRPEGNFGTPGLSGR